MSKITWNVEHEAPVGTRILGSDFWSITTDWTENGSLWWDHGKREWITDEVMHARRGGYSSHAPCRSYKAFLRHLRRHGDTLQGRKVHLVSRWVGHDVLATSRSQYEGAE